MAPSWSVPARLSTVVVRGHTYSVRAPVSLRGDEVRHLRYGSRISLSGRASESFSPEAQSLTLRVLGPVHVRSPPGAVARVTTTDPGGLPGSLRRAAGRRRGAPARAGRRRRVHPSRGSRRGDGPCRPGPPHRCQRLEHVAGRRHRDGCGGGGRAGLAGSRRHVPGGAVGVRDACQAPAQRAACRRHGGGRPCRALGRGSPSRSAGTARPRRWSSCSCCRSSPSRWGSRCPSRPPQGCSWSVLRLPNDWAGGRAPRGCLSRCAPPWLWRQQPTWPRFPWRS